MPTYEYRCLTCEKHFDVVQSFSDNELTVCNCGKEQPVRKVFTPVGITFKGSGFYKNDSRGGSSSSRSGGSEKSDSSSSDSSSSSSSESSSTPGGHSHDHGGHSHSHGDSAPSTPSTPSTSTST